jgi:TDG/mug DNA glycosylase family protein
MNENDNLTSLSPVVSTRSRILILGSMPGAESLRRQQYYAHPRNTFWYIMGQICGANFNLPYQDRLIQMKQAGFALWDVLKHCQRQGSLDAKIVNETEEPNDFGSFLNAYPAIRLIGLNGGKAADTFKKKVWADLPAAIHQRISLVRLPSTSPANARLSRDEKLTIWRNKLSVDPLTSGDYAPK